MSRPFGIVTHVKLLQISFNEPDWLMTLGQEVGWKVVLCSKKTANVVKLLEPNLRIIHFISIFFVFKRTEIVLIKRPQ